MSDLNTQAPDKVKFNRLTTFTLNNLKGYAPTEYNYEVNICSYPNDGSVVVLIKVSLKDESNEARPKYDASCLAKAIRDDNEVFYYIDNLISNEFCVMSATGGAIYTALYTDDESITLLDSIKYEEFSAEDYFFDNERTSSEVAICYDPHGSYALVITSESKESMKDVELLETDNGTIKFNRDKPNVQFKDNEFVIVEDTTTLTKKESLAKELWKQVGKDIWDNHCVLCANKNIYPAPKEWGSLSDATRAAINETIYDYTLSQINETPRPTSIRSIKPQSMALMQSADEYFGVTNPQFINELFPFTIPEPTAMVVDVQPLLIETQQ